MTTRTILFLLVTFVFAGATLADERQKEPLKGVLLFEFGQINADRTIKSSTEIPWVIGGKYGWSATIVSKEPKVILKEVLVLPGPAVFRDGKSKKKPEQVLKAQQSVTADRILTTEVTLDATKPLAYGRGYTIIEGDPEGQHVLRLYVNGELAREVKFTLTKETEPSATANPPSLTR